MNTRKFFGCGTRNLFFAIAVLFALAFIACEQFIGLAAPTLTGITANYTSGSVTINTGVNSLKSNLTVTAQYSDNTSKTLNAADYSLSGDLSASGQKTVTVTYEGKTTTFTVSVTTPAPPTPAAITYTVTQIGGVDNTTDTTAINFTFSASVTGLTANNITVINGNGFAVTKGILSGSGTSWTLGITVTTAGSVMVQIAKTGIEAATKFVTVYKAGEAAPTLTGISADYTQGSTVIYPSTPLEDLWSGLTVTAQYSNGATYPVWPYALSVSDSGTLTVGTSTVTVTYEGKETTFNVTVTAPPEIISLSNLSIRDSSIKSLYISNIPVNSGARNARAVSGSAITTLSYINNLGQNAPFFFVSPSGKNIVLGVSKVQQLDDKRIVVDFSSFYQIMVNDNVFTVGETITEYGRALIDMESGKVYDFKDYFNGYDNVHFVSNDLLFTIENRTLYKVDLNNISNAVPLNNPTYNPVSSINPLILFGNKVLTGSDNRLSIDINNQFPPKSITDAVLTPEICSFINTSTALRITENIGYSNGIVLTDLSGNPYFYSFDTFLDRYYSSTKGTNYLTGRLSIDDDGNILLSDYYEGEHTFSTNWYSWDVYMGNRDSHIFIMNSAGMGKIHLGGYLNSDFYKSQSIILYSDNGFIHLKKKINGIQVESTALSMPNVVANSSFINKDNYLYYLEGSSIKRLYLASGETPEVVYTNSRLLTSGASIDYLMASGSNIIFYQYADDNISVNTYSLAMYQQGATPRIMASSSIDVKDIIELNF